MSVYKLASRPENAMLVTAGVRWVAVARLDGSDLIHIHTAATEACNNVAQHAYPGEEGPLDVAVELALDAVTVVVRDRASGPGATRRRGARHRPRAPA